MSINHYYSLEIPEAHWWSHYNSTPQTSSSSLSNNNHKHFLSPPNSAGPMFNASFDLNNDDDEEFAETPPSTEAADQRPRQSKEEEIPKERLFEKPLTPSDVGKLNRLVIPKQQAEKHFPLNGSGGDSGESGLLLGFEDELGKSWRFRYSYWNSSQSYVLTKGWSRFVKEKRLDAGDIVVFARHRVDTGRLFIGWRRRNSGEVQAVANGGGGWSSRVVYPYPNHHQHQQLGQSNSVSHHQPGPPCLHAAAGLQQNQTGAATGGNSKRLRLFGVNLECQLAADDSEPSTPVGSPISSQGQAHLQYHPAAANYHHHQYYSNHMDMISFSGADVYRQG